MNAEFEQAVVSLQQGDKQAFRVIVQACQATIRTLIACKGVSLADVDDIAQATFLQVYQDIEHYQVGTNFMAWICTIALYKTMAFLEKQNRELKQRNMLLQHFIQQQVRDIAVEGDQRAQHLAHCLERLGERGRSLIQKRYEGMALVDIAQEWQRSVPAIKMMLLRIRNQLRECVEAQT